MYKKILLILITTLFLSCGNSFKDSTLSYNLVSEPSTIDPHLFNELVSVQVMNTVYEGLLRLDENNNYQMAMAKSLVEKDNTLCFTLRDDIKWSNGEKITTDHFVNGFRRALNKNTAARFAELLFPIKNAEKYNKGLVTEDELGVKNINNKLVITLEKPAPYFKYILTLPISFPIKNEKEDTITDYTKALYNGPYVIKSLNNSEILLEKNKYYYDKDNVEFKNIKYLIISDFSVVENLIKNKELDISRVEAYDIKSKKDNGELLNYENGRIWYLDFNVENDILKDKKNRILIRDAINRESYVKDIKDDGSIVSKSVISNILNKFRDKYPDYDYFKDNIKNYSLKGKHIRLLASNTSTEIKEASFLQEELRSKLGLNVDVTIVSFKDRLALTREKNYDIVLNTYSPKYEDPLSILERWYKPKNDTYAFWRKKEYENLIDEIKKENDMTKRLNLAYMAEKILIDDAFIAPIYYSTENWYIRKGLKNIIVHPISNTMDLHKIKSTRY